MIRINLLPPEFRKRSGAGLNPDALGLAAGILVSLVVVGFWAYVDFVRIPFAEKRIKDLQAEFQVAKREADKVREIEKEIKKFEGRLAVLEDLTEQKVFWAGAISDFADMLGRDRWSMGGFQVSSGSLSISPAAEGGGRRGRASDKKEDQRYNFRWSMELIGDEFDLAGNYIYTFFTDVKDTAFWIENGFLGDPVEPYSQDRPELLKELGKVKVTHSLQWVRSQSQEEENRKLLAEQRSQEKAEADKGATGAAVKGDG